MKKGKWLFVLLAAGWLALSVPASASSDAKERLGLPEKVPLKLRYPVGETLHYRLRRTNHNFRMDGTKSGEMRVVTFFTRTRLDDDGQGRIQERLIWKGFWFGQSMTAASAKMTEFEEGNGFSLVYSVNDPDPDSLSKLDFSSLPRTFEGVMFMVLTWDAVTFDGVCRPTPGFAVPDEALLGAEFADTTGGREFRFAYPPLVTDSKYVFSGKSRARVDAVTRIRDVPCAVLDFAHLENRVEMNLRVGAMEISMRGLEHFWGKTYLSLVDGRVVAGELYGPVAMIQSTKLPGQDKPELTDLCAIQYLDMALLSEEEFQAEVAAIRAASSGTK